MDALQQAIEKMIDEKLGVKEKNFNEVTIPFVAGFATAMALSAMKYERVTGLEFTDSDTKNVFALMEKIRLFDPRPIMERYIRGERADSFGGVQVNVQ
jgi:hypothetical protein